MVLSNDTILNEGEFVLLTCVGYGLPYVAEINWTLNGKEVRNSSLVSIYKLGLPYGGFEQSFLQLCAVGRPDSGVYTCTVSNGSITASATTRLDVDSGGGGGGGGSVGAIVGGVVGGVALTLVLVMVCVVVAVLRKKHTTRTPYMSVATSNDVNYPNAMYEGQLQGRGNYLQHKMHVIYKG